MPENCGDVTQLLAEVRLGGTDAIDRLIPLVYQELRRIAAEQMRRERAGHTLQPTALVHEAFLRLVKQDPERWQNRAHFYGVAGQLMRRLLVDHARRRHAAKRGTPVTLHEEIVPPGCGRHARVAELRYFGGLSVEETAEALGIHPRTVKLDWTMAKGWLKSQLSRGGV
jgi:RNA polymerase sigma-70 factor (ECF subfamily)